MDTGSANDPIKDLMKVLSLENYYPEKLSTDDLYVITDLRMEAQERVTPETICWHFINRIKSFNYKARNLKIEHELKETRPRSYLHRQRSKAFTHDSINVHPMDVIVAVFICCDPIAKQDLVRFMWGCKISIPFILQTGNPDPMIWKWPLRALISQWQEEGDTMANEFPIIQHPMQKVAFVRFGDLEESKSAILNGIIGGPEKAHPMFFHRDLYGSTKTRSAVVNGLVEIGWYFPKGASTDRFDSCKTFLNLRGDACKHHKQLHLLLETMDLIVVISRSKYLLTRLDSFRAVVSHSKKSILLLTDDTISDETENIDHFLKNVGDYNERDFEVLPLEDMRLADKLEHISDYIKEMNNNDFESLDTCFDDKLNANIDEIHWETINKGITAADDIVSETRKLLRSTGKQSLLPLQGELWEQWTKTDLETHKLECLNQTDKPSDISTYLDDLDGKKYDIRSKQFQLSQSCHPVLRKFMTCLSTLDDTSLQVFLRRFKLGMDDISRTNLRPYYNRYKELLEQKSKADESAQAQLNHDFEKLESEKANMSIGMEHMIRELGQMFESYRSQAEDKSFEQIPTLAAKIMLNGYPIEIMDGDVGCVPDVWITEVLLRVKQQLQMEDERRVCVISVLGIQSSGKSTLLNTLFGVQFSVSAGRCTKGVFMQMLKVSPKLKARFNSDHIIIIDTEGLRATHLSTERSTKFDNELSFFTLGLADLTIVNLMGENAKYLEENLPVVVHAILRMEMAGLKPKCIIVHQNVDKSNKAKLMEQARLLETKLNEHTAKACDIEGILPHKLFDEIIEFDVNDNMHYIPSLLEGELPMGPISIGYSQECETFRDKIFYHCESKSRHLTMSEFACHLKNLWNAIKVDQFVFRFRSTAETQTSLQLEEFYSEVHRSLLAEIMKRCEEVQRQFEEGGISQESFSIMSGKLREHINCIGKDHRVKLLSFIDDTSTMYSYFMQQWKEAKLVQFDSDLHEATLEAMNQFQKKFDKAKLLNQNWMVSKTESEEMSELRYIMKTQRKQEIHESDNEYARRISLEWINKTRKPTSSPDTSFIRRDVEQLLLQMFEPEKHRIERALNSPRAEMDFATENFSIKESHIKRIGETISFSDAGKIAKILIESIQKELQSLVVRRKSCTKSVIRKLLLEMKMLLERNKTKFTKDFKVDICIFVSDHIIRFLSDVSIKEMKAEEDSGICHRQRCVLAVMQEETNQTETYCADRSVEFVIDKIVEKAIKYLPNYLSNSESFRLCSKLECLNYLLCKTVLNDDESLIVQYIYDPETALIKMLANDINIELVKRDAVIDFDNETKNLMACLRLPCTKSESVDQLISRLFQKANVNVNQDFIKVLQSKGLQANNVQERMLQQVDKARLKGNENLLHEIESKKDAIKQDIAKTFQEGLGCFERCPSCNEICIHSTQNHTGHHQASGHRPVVSEKGTNRIAFNTCPLVGRSKSVLRFSLKKSTPDNWHISDDLSEDSYMWKWFFANHNRLLYDESYKINVPYSWTKITKSMVVHRLRAASGKLKDKIDN